MTRPKVHSPFTRAFYFWIGVIATVAYRIIVILNNYDKTWAQLSWYIGTVGFIIYFIHRYEISERRFKLIQQHNLMEKMKNANLNKEEQEAMEYILKTLTSTKEKWNYIFIFAMSIVGLVAGLYLDFFAPK